MLKNTDSSRALLLPLHKDLDEQNVCVCVCVYTIIWLNQIIDVKTYTA